MSEGNLLNIVPQCPECGSNLSVEILGPDPSGDDRVFCQSCGFEAGTRNDVISHIGENHREEISNAAADAIRDALRKALGQ